MERENIKAQNGLQRVHTIPGVLLGAVCISRFLRGQAEFQSSEVLKGGIPNFENILSEKNLISLLRLGTYFFQHCLA